MNPLKFLFAIILKWVPVDPHEFAKIQGDANEWFSKIQIEKPEAHKPYEVWLKKNGEDWRFKLLLAVLYVPVSNWVRDQLDPNKSSNDDKLTL